MLKRAFLSSILLLVLVLPVLLTAPLHRAVAEGMPPDSRPDSVTAGSITVQAGVAASNDDAGSDYYACGYSTGHLEIFFGECQAGSPLTSGFRFANLHVPRNAKILSAFVRFRVGSYYSDDLNVSLGVEANSNPLPFSTASKPADRAIVPGLAVPWHISSSDPWNVGVYTGSPSITPLVQNIVDRADWASGNALAVIVKNVGPSTGPLKARSVLAYDRDGASSGATLIVTYETLTQPGETMTVRRASLPPVIDGDLVEWYGLHPTYLDRYNASYISKEVPEPWDNSIYLRMMWDPGHLYFGGVIYDQKLIGNNSAQPWGDDSLELALYSATGPYQFTATVDGRQAYQGSVVNAMTFMTSTIPGGWLVEGSIPVDKVGVGVFLPEVSYPFNFALWDDDTGDTWGQTHMYWTSDSTTTYKPNWGTVTLSNNVWLVTTPTPTPTATVTPTATHTPSPTVTATPAPGAIRGFVWHDKDGDGQREPGEPGLASVQVRLLSGGAVFAVAYTSGTGGYEFSGLAPGTYEVVETHPPSLRYSSTPDRRLVVLAGGATEQVDFGDWDGLPAWLPMITK